MSRIGIRGLGLPKADSTASIHPCPARGKVVSDVGGFETGGS
jgi:hypothetical protein